MCTQCALSLAHPLECVHCIDTTLHYDYYYYYLTNRTWQWQLNVLVIVRIEWNIPLTLIRTRMLSTLDMSAKLCSTVRMCCWKGKPRFTFLSITHTLAQPLTTFQIHRCENFARITTTIAANRSSVICLKRQSEWLSCRSQSTLSVDDDDNNNTE